MIPQREGYGRDMHLRAHGDIGQSDTWFVQGRGSRENMMFLSRRFQSASKPAKLGGFKSIVSLMVPRVVSWHEVNWRLATVGKVFPPAPTQVTAGAQEHLL